MSILIIGGSGYIGSHTVKYFIEQNEDVIIVDNLLTGHKEAVLSDKFYNCDIRDKESLDKVFKENNIGAVIHFAANSLVGESMVKPYEYYHNNVYGMMCLLDVMKENNVDKIVFSSTAATYGEPKNIPILESDETNPTNTYGETKLAMEKMMKWFDNAYGTKYVSLRSFNAAKDGTCIRDYIHVMDLASAHYKALEYLRKGNESNIFNLGNGNGYSVKEVIDVARKVTNHEIPAKLEDRRSGDPAVLIASSDKARKVLGWKPEYDSLERIIEDAWRWHKNNVNGYKKLMPNL